MGLMFRKSRPASDDPFVVNSARDALEWDRQGIGPEL